MASTSPEPGAKHISSLERTDSEKTTRLESRDDKEVVDDIDAEKGLAANEPARNQDFLRYDKPKWYVHYVPQIYF